MSIGRLSIGAVFCTALLAASAPTRTEVQEVLPYCEVELAMQNRNRHVYGNVSAECTFGCSGFPDFEHTHPFGNWGVSSNVGARWDARQYQGWATYNPYCSESMNDPEWNSCTGYGSGQSNYFNWANNTEQYSADIGTYGVEYRYMATTENEGCAVWDGGQFTVWGNFMDLYELDWDGDDYITQLTFDDTAVTLQCDYNQCAEAYSEWKSSSNSITSAQIRIRAIGTFVYR